MVGEEDLGMGNLLDGGSRMERHRVFQNCMPELLCGRSIELQIIRVEREIGVRSDAKDDRRTRGNEWSKTMGLTVARAMVSQRPNSVQGQSLWRGELERRGGEWCALGGRRVRKWFWCGQGVVHGTGARS